MAGMVHLTVTDQVSIGTDAPVEGVNKHLVDEVVGGRGQPKSDDEGLEGLV
jgi:hypothetical protein